MKTHLSLRNARRGFLVLAIALFVAMPAHLFAQSLAAQSAGSIEFAAHVTPTDAHPEPVRQLTFFLLTRSLSDIRQEIVQQDPPPDFTKFVDDLKVTPELKNWMKKNKSVQLSGSDFIKGLTADDILYVPEFFNAYMARNVGFEGTGFPTPKYKEKDLTANPAKYAQQKQQYLDSIRKFIAAYPDSVQGIEADLEDVNPDGMWLEMVAAHGARVEKLTLELAETRYLAAQTDTDLDGRGSFTGLAPGDYWLGTLGTQAIAGDMRIRWDRRVTVRPGEISRVELTNLNAVEPSSAKPDSIR